MSAMALVGMSNSGHVSPGRLVAVVFNFLNLHAYPSYSRPCANGRSHAPAVGHDEAPSALGAGGSRCGDRTDSGGVRGERRDQGRRTACLMCVRPGVSVTATTATSPSRCVRRRAVAAGRLPFTWSPTSPSPPDAMTTATGSWRST